MKIEELKGKGRTVKYHKGSELSYDFIYNWRRGERSKKYFNKAW